MAAAVTGARARWRRNQLARIRLQNPKALPHVNLSDGVNRRESRRIRSVAARKGLLHAPRTGKRAAPGYNPLAPLSGKALNNEIAASTKLQFGGQEDNLGTALRDNTQATANTGQYYQDYLNVLNASNARIASIQNNAAAQTQGNVDRAYQQDTARVQQADAQQAEQAAKFGRPAAPSAAGAQAVSAQRAQGNDAAGRVRQQGATEQTYSQRLAANSVLAKAEALAKKQQEHADLLKKRDQLRGQEGAFKVAERGKLRESERTYALSRKEFGLKKEQVRAGIVQGRAQTKADLQKIAAQKIVAGLYAGADQAKARAQIRVAQLQLKKGKIDQHQYRQIVNIYHGLPKKGTSPQAKGGGGRQGIGSGPGGSLAPWEQDKLDPATRSIGAHKPDPSQRAKVIGNLVKAGIPARLARLAWNRYVRSIGRAGTGRGVSTGKSGRHLD